MMKYLIGSLLLLSLLLSGCLSVSGGGGYQDIDALIEEAAWEMIDVLWNHYEDLEDGPVRSMAVYDFLEQGKVSPLSDQLIEGLTTAIANAVADEGIQVRLVSRTSLDQILQELAFQRSDLVDPDTQLSVGRQLGAGLIVTGTVRPTDRGRKINLQLIEVESGAVLGGQVKYLQAAER